MNNQHPKKHDPSRRDKLKPLELVGFSAVLAVFAGLIVAMVTKDFAVRVPIIAGIVFIVALMVLALLGLSMKPNPEDVLARKALEEQHKKDLNNGAHG